MLQISLCEDYSLPVDFVNKRRPVSAAATTSTVQWALPSPTIDKVSFQILLFFAYFQHYLKFNLILSLPLQQPEASLNLQSFRF